MSLAMNVEHEVPDTKDYTLDVLDDLHWYCDEGGKDKIVKYC